MKTALERLEARAYGVGSTTDKPAAPKQTTLDMVRELAQYVALKSTKRHSVIHSLEQAWTREGTFGHHSIAEIEELERARRRTDHDLGYALTMLIQFVESLPADMREEVDAELDKVLVET